MRTRIKTKNEEIPLSYVKKKKQGISIELKEETILIPSKIYPLTKKRDIKVHYHENTEVVEEEKVKAIFNAVQAQVGKCYTNAELLYTALKKAGIKEVKYMVGWLMVSPTQANVIHHAWVLYKDKHILDYGDSWRKQTLQQNFFTAYQEKIKGKTVEEIQEIHRMALVAIYEEESKLAFSECKVFGKVVPTRLYVGVESSRIEGRKQFDHLMNRYHATNPHPSYPTYFEDLKERDGRDKLQETLYQAKKEKA